MKLSRFSSSIVYTDRKSKSNYVYEKYNKILTPSVLDVGADAMYLKPLVVSSGGKYVGIGHGDSIDYEINLEQIPLPFDARSFETVLCLDVLEHLEWIHNMFDELCRISNKYVIISLPNPWGGFFSVLLKGDYSPTERLKFYGLPVDQPSDRHRWFFSECEAKTFVNEKASRNGFSVIQSDAGGDGKPMGGYGLRGFVGRAVLKLIFRNDINNLGLHHGTFWFVLERKG